MENKQEIIILQDKVTEDTPLLSSVKLSKKVPIMVSAANVVGSVTTFMAMVPQGLLGLLLADKVLLQLNEEFNGKNIPLLIVRIGIDGLIFVTAEEGKRRLVRFFNTETFKSFGQKEWWKNNFFTGWTGLNTLAFIVNGAFTLVASGVFVGLAAISFEGVAELLSAYQNSVTDEISAWVRTYYIKAPFMLATLICNLPFFPVAHKAVFYMLCDAAYYLVENPAFRSYKQSIVINLQAARLLWKRINETEANDMKIDFLSACQEKENEFLSEELIKIGQTSAIKITTESWPEFVIKHMSAIGLSCVGIIGLYNFLSMTDKVATIFHLEKIAPVVRWMDYISMSAVAIGAIYPMVIAVMNRCFGRHYQVNLLSTASYLWILFSAVLVCLLGGTPNAYQSVLAKESLVMIMIAAIDSLMIEVYGYYQLTTDKKIKSLCDQNETNKQAYEMDAKIENAITHVEELSAVKEQATNARYRPLYTSIKNAMNCCFFSSHQPEALIINRADYEEIAVQMPSGVTPRTIPI